MILKPQPRRPRALLSCLILSVVSMAVLPLSVCTLWAEPAASPEAAKAKAETSKAAKRETTEEKSEVAGKPKLAGENDEKGEKVEAVAPTGGEFVETESGKDWNANYDSDKTKIDEQLYGIVRTTEFNVNLVQTNLNRREASLRQLEAVQAAFDAGSVSMDQLLEAQRRVAEAKSSYVRTVCDLHPDSDRTQRLNVEANLAIVDEALNDARRTWAKAYKRLRAGKQGGEAEAEAHAREQYYQFKSQRESMGVKWKEIQDRAGKKTSSLPSHSEILTRANEIDLLLPGKSQLPAVVKPEAAASSASKSDDRTAIQSEKVRREWTQFHHYELQLRREKLKLKDLEHALAASEGDDDSQDGAQQDQNKKDLHAQIEKARMRVEKRERELEAAKGILYRLISTFGTSSTDEKGATDRY